MVVGLACGLGEMLGEGLGDGLTAGEGDGPGPGVLELEHATSASTPMHAATVDASVARLSGVRECLGTAIPASFTRRP